MHHHKVVGAVWSCRPWGYIQASTTIQGVPRARKLFGVGCDIDVDGRAGWRFDFRDVRLQPVGSVFPLT